MLAGTAGRRGRSAVGPTRRRPVGAGGGRPCADGETRTLTDGDLNAVPLPIGLRRLTRSGYGNHGERQDVVELDETLHPCVGGLDDERGDAAVSVVVQP